jgi:hypothetical protein
MKTIQELKRHVSGPLLSDDAIRLIRSTKQHVYRPGILAKIYGVSTETLRKIRSGQTYKWVE